MRDFMSVSKALADENRVRILLALDGRELCVCQIIELLKLAPSTVSKHMSILKHARLVESKKDGRWNNYSLPGATAPREVQSALAWVRQSLLKDSRIKEDTREIKRILKLEPCDLCSCQSEKRGKTKCRK